MTSQDSISAAPALARFTYRRSAIPVGPLAVVGGAFIAVVATHLIDFGADHLRVGLLNATSDTSWSHLLVALTLVAAAAAAVLGALRSTRQRGVWSAAASILAFLAIDEVTPLHKHVDNVSWGKALYAPILLVLGVCVWKLSARTDQQRILRTGLATLVVSFCIHVFGLHVVHALGWGTGSWAYQVKVALKEGTELAGWLLIMMGAVAFGASPRFLAPNASLAGKL